MKYKLPLMVLWAALIVLQSCKLSVNEQSDPASVNMSAERLDQIDSLLRKSVENKWINGAVAYISRDNKTVYYKAFGMDDPEKQKALEKDAIFRIASQTKAITSVAVMMLFEEGKLLLDDPVFKYVPEFSDVKVIDQFNAADTTYTTKPAERAITIRDLLTHTSGIDYAVIGSPNMVAIYQKAGIPSGFENRPLILGDQIKKLATLPLAHQPGLQFTYGLNTDVLGYIVEVVSGKSLDRFFKERIFDPLEMNDTYFYIPPEKAERLVAVSTEDASGKLRIIRNPVSGIDVNYPLVKGTYYSGGAGLSSTITDYARFLHMLVNNGKYKGNRILAERTIELMTSNQIGDLSLGKDKFGLGFGITTKEGKTRLGVSEGSFAWGGFFGTTYWGDPEENLVCLLFCQQYPLSHGEISDKFTVLVYSALDD